MAQEVAPFLREQLLRQYGGDVTAQIESGYAQRRLTTLRVNRLKAEPDAVRAALAEAGITVEDVAWSGDALVLPEADGRAVTALPLYARGEVYMQSLSSMLPPLLLGAQPGENVLDMAAAPGGKTTQIAALTGNGAMITALQRAAAGRDARDGDEHRRAPARRPVRLRPHFAGCAVQRQRHRAAFGKLPRAL